ncbi:hypothetical protein GUITHDRAFT_155059 [Guillardia theta CCMP2712]|uniref:Uncharacterized protein n=1 Tax=Guillardia theta (strain CCMP2712) TaxID=905079 RepID=L1ILA9_GUITC|nr:hypothetical protein GUITHDRAFT_155059 [Guillardia theta CCMP2712]EKX37031.1 hypothetical protein GUITHDRAFT_155059 [Guillardia theta CCMP2712]|eukprot:XP_005824011.1 hypothetical protein GUITHDRAFT_155059 [Guillardia theta CCMP2712]
MQKEDRELEEGDDYNMERVALRPRSSRLKAKMEKMESEKASDLHIGHAYPELSHETRDDDVCGQEKMKSRKRVKHDRNMRDYIPKQDEVIYQHPAKSSSLHVFTLRLHVNHYCIPENLHRMGKTNILATPVFMKETIFWSKSNLTF